jgi:nucleoside-diphosphate-sugar epimerase
MKNVLVTGAAGFIGSKLCTKLVNLNYNVIGLDNLQRSEKINLQSILLKNNFSLHVCDLRNHDFEQYFWKDIDTVIHLAGIVSGIQTYIHHPYSVFNTNTTIDKNIFDVCIKYKIKNIFYASSSHIYKTLHSDNPLKETDCLESDLSYGVAKQVGENTLKYIHNEKYPINIAIGRLTGIYGPNQSYNINDGSIIPVLCYKAIKYPQIPFNILTNGEEYRSYCYVDDAIDAIFVMINKLSDNNFVGPYNICKHEKIKIIDICEKIVHTSKKDIIVEKSNNKSLINCQWCSAEKIKKDIGWEAKTTFDFGLAETYKDIQNKINLENNESDHY